MARYIFGAVEMVFVSLAHPVSAVAAVLGALLRSERLLAWAEGNIAIGRRWPL